MRSALYEGTLTHVRRAPARNAFRYRVCFCALDLDELERLDADLRLFSHNRSNLFSLRDADHHGDTSRDIKRNVLDTLAAEGIDLAGGRVTLLTSLRTLGYVFNPVSFFYCYDRSDELRCVVAEVSNTFGERHLYVLPEPGAAVRGRRRWRRAKRLHVSPFFGLEQEYRFTLTEPGERVLARIEIYEGDARPFWATLAGRRRPLTDAALARTLVRHPLMSQQVTALIHLQAARLWAKGVPFHRKPPIEPGRGSRPAPPADAPGRRGLRPPPPARRSPLTPLAHRAALWALAHPARGHVSLRLPDGTVRRAGDLATGPAVEVTIASRDLYRRLARRGRLALGEGYVAGDWWADDLPGLLWILAHSVAARREQPPWRTLTRLADRRPHLPRRRSVAGDRRDIRYHYDLGNDLYALFLDASMTYSCALFEHPGQTLEEAQQAKYRRICDALQLGPGDRVLEIGCGWGGFALHAARERGARVTGLTLSQAQATLARERAAAAGVGDRVQILERDYRRHDGGYDAVVSIEMLEAVGHDGLSEFFAACERLLAPGGRVGLQSIAVPDRQYERYRRSTDWIREYVFPGGNIPSLEAIVAAMGRASRLAVREARDIGPHYARTLRLWRERFLAAAAEVRRLGYDERFVRGWEYYLAFCEAAFASRALHDYQLVLARPLADR